MGPAGLGPPPSLRKEFGSVASTARQRRYAPALHCIVVARFAAAWSEFEAFAANVCSRDNRSRRLSPGSAKRSPMLCT